MQSSVARKTDSAIVVTSVSGMNSTRKSSTPAECPVCGAEVPPNAKACPECGADERTGWNEDMTLYDGMDLPESAFEESDKKDRPTDGLFNRAFFWVTAVVLLATFIALFCRA